MAQWRCRAAGRSYVRELQTWFHRYCVISGLCTFSTVKQAFHEEVRVLSSLHRSLPLLCLSIIVFTWITDTMALGDAQLRRSKDDPAAFPASDLWKDSPVLVVVLRRPGCVSGREILTCRLRRAPLQPCCRCQAPTATGHRCELPSCARSSRNIQLDLKRTSKHIIAMKQLLQVLISCRLPTRAAAVPRAGGQAVDGAGAV